MAFIFFTLQSNLSSAGFIRSSMFAVCEYPTRCSLRRNRSNRSLSAALAQPHHAGAAYRRRLIVVAYRKQCIVLQPVCPRDAERMRRGGAFAYDVVHMGCN